MHITTAERLQSYFAFDEATLETADEVAGRQQSMGWQEFLNDCGLQQAPQKYLVERRATEFIEFRPRGDFDPTEARVFHAPMANPLDPNIAYQAATIFAFDPRTRLFATANPSGPGRDAGLLDHYDRARVAAGDLTPTVTPVLALLARAGVESVVHIGSSYGAEKVMTAVANSAQYEQSVDAVTAIEPPAVKDRSRLGLASAFAKTNAHLSEYVAASDVPAFDAARRESVGFWDYSLGLLRLSNLAIASGLTKDNFQSRSEAALDAQPEMRATLIWGSASELAIDGLTKQIVTDLQNRFGEERVGAIRLPGQYHALMNDIHLQAALARSGDR